jgi:hypothetical protein
MSAGFYKVGKIDMIVISHPFHLGHMAFQHFKFLINNIGDVHIFRWLKIYASQRVHIIDGGQVGWLVYRRFVMGNTGGKASVKNKATYRYMIRHESAGL